MWFNIIINCCCCYHSFQCSSHLSLLRLLRLKIQVELCVVESQKLTDFNSLSITIAIYIVLWLYYSVLGYSARV